ncbi:MAG: choice-of-anchor J domain-containing protein [Lepagella sp.]
MKLYKILSLSLFISLITASAEAAVSEIRCDFSSGIPEDFTLIDADGNTLSPDVAKFGFSQGDSWIAYMIEEEQNAVAQSTSWYSPAGTSSDWMILPALAVESGSALSWRAKVCDRRFADGYAIYISESASTPEEFMATSPIFVIEQESDSWANHSVDLSAFADKEIRIAFVNNSTDKSRLYIDDIIAGTPALIGLELDMPLLHDVTLPLTLSGYLLNRGNHDLNGYTISAKINGDVISQAVDAVLVPGERVPFIWTTDYKMTDKGLYDLLLNVSSGDATAEISKQLRFVNHKILLEEGTGTWCGWCIRGIVAIKQALETYPDGVVPIAIHSRDLMELEDYTPHDVMSATGLPASTLNRVKELDPNPSLMLLELGKQLETPIDAALEASVSLDDTSGKVDINAQVWFDSFYNDGDYRIFCAAIENDVHHPESNAYQQNNAYSGGSEMMGGYENKPSPIPASDMYYQEVARGLLTPLRGEVGSLPSSLKYGEEASWSGEFTLPDNIDNLEKVNIVVAIVDGRTNRVLNSQSIPLIQTSNIRELYPETKSGIDWNVYYEIYDLTGTQQKMPVEPGLYILRQNEKIYKIIITH